MQLYNGKVHPKLKCQNLFEFLFFFFFVTEEHILKNVQYSFGLHRLPVEGQKKYYDSQ